VQELRDLSIPWLTLVRQFGFGARPSRPQHVFLGNTSGIGLQLSPFSRAAAWKAACRNEKCLCSVQPLLNRVMRLNAIPRKSRAPMRSFRVSSSRRDANVHAAAAIRRLG